MPTALLSAAGVEGCPHGPKAGGALFPPVGCSDWVGNHSYSYSVSSHRGFSTCKVLILRLDFVGKWIFERFKQTGWRISQPLDIVGESAWEVYFRADFPKPTLTIFCCNFNNFRWAIT